MTKFNNPTQVLIVNLIGLGILLVLACLLAFGGAGFFTWTKHTCNVLNCTVTTRGSIQIEYGTTVELDGQFQYLTGIYSVQNGLCSTISKEMTCFSNGNILSNVMTENLWYLFLIIPMAIDIIVMGLSWFKSC